MTLAVGAVAALLAALGALADVGIGMATGGSVSAPPHEAAGRFAEILANPALGLYNLDLLNLVTTLIMMPAIYACWVVLKREGPAAGLALSLAVIGAAVFVANNPALPMLGLSAGYSSADPARQAFLAAAGEAILARGGHGSPGALPGFLLATAASLVLSGEMLRTRVFSRVTGLLGLAGNLLLGAYLILVTFLPKVRDMALAFAAPGGLLAIAWMFLIALRLARLSAAAPPTAAPAEWGR
jgi:hypothetical protein